MPAFTYHFDPTHGSVYIREGQNPTVERYKQNRFHLSILSHPVFIESRKDKTFLMDKAQEEVFNPVLAKVHTYRNAIKAVDKISPKKFAEREAVEIKHTVVHNLLSHKKAVVRVQCSSVVSAKFDKGMYGSKDTITFRLGYMWRRRVWNKIYEPYAETSDKRKEAVQDYFILEAIQTRTNARGINLYRVKVYEFKSKVVTEGFIAQSAIGHPGLGSFSPNAGAAIESGMRVASIQIDRKLKQEQANG